ncbi:MAG: CHAT domain-containing protein [Lacipirellulaceae bacterium]
MSRARTPSASLVSVLAGLALAIVAPRASAQLGAVVPGPGYFAAIEELYSGEYRNAARDFQSEVRTATRTVDARWIDSMAYFAMLGDALEKQGQHAAALENYTLALELFLADPRWLQRINFQQGPRPDVAAARRLPPWATSARNPAYCELPRSVLAAVGQLDNRAAAQQGGVIRQAQFWKVDAQEIARTIGWAIYRRGRLLGPLAASDPLQRRTTDSLARGGLGLGAHWSSAWIELWWGLAAASTGDAAAAAPHLERGTLLDGRWDHGLTSLALVARARLALEGGDLAAAETLCGEALTAALVYDDFGVVAEAASLGEAIGALAGATPRWLDPLSQAATRSGLHHIVAEARLGVVEGLIHSGESAMAADLLATAFARSREVEGGPLGADATRLRAMLAATAGRGEETQTLATRAVGLKRPVSLRNFRLALATARVDDGTLSPRSAVTVFPALLGDPRPIDWADDPLDVLASFGVDQTGAFDRWFAALTARRDTPATLGLIDLERRRRFLAAQPVALLRVGGLRRLLEASDETLTPDERAQRAVAFERLPGYARARSEGTKAGTALRDVPGLFADATPESADEPLASLVASVAARERTLAAVALSRWPTPLGYPPAVALEGVEERLAEGEVLCAFHQTRSELQGLVVTADGVHAWLVGDASDVRGLVIELLGKVAGVSPQQRWTADELASTDWHEPAARLGEVLFAESRIDFAKTKLLTVVPDGALWHLPWEAVLVGSAAGDKRPLGDTVAVRVSPTPGLATRLRAAPRPALRAGVVGAQAASPDTPADPLRAALPELERVGDALPANVVRGVLDTLVVDSGIEFSPAAPYAVSLVPRGKKEPGNLIDWQMTPHPGPRGVVITRSRTIAERQLKGSRRGGSRGGDRTGDELFQATCAILAPGVESVLLSRWTTEGTRAREIAAEYLIGIADASPTAALRRSLRLAKSMPLEARLEPRLDVEVDGAATPDASHPFFWSGYLLVE